MIRVHSTCMYALEFIIGHACMCIIHLHEKAYGYVYSHDYAICLYMSTLYIAHVQIHHWPGVEGGGKRPGGRYWSGESVSISFSENFTHQVSELGKVLKPIEFCQRRCKFSSECNISQLGRSATKRIMSKTFEYYLTSAKVSYGQSVSQWSGKCRQLNAIEYVWAL